MICCSTFGTRAFSVAGLTVWNSLPIVCCVIVRRVWTFDAGLENAYLFAGHYRDITQYGVVSPYHEIALYKSTFTCLLTYLLFVGSRV